VKEEGTPVVRVRKPIGVAAPLQTTCPEERSGGVACAGGSAWVTSFERNAVLRVDRATNKVGAVVPVGDWPIGVVAVAGSIWVADWSGGAVTRIDPSANSSIATIPVGPSEGA
jgi:YVTN family beta-propeller protein